MNSTGLDSPPVLSADGLTLYFRSDRTGGLRPDGTFDIWFSQRDAIGDEWGIAENLGPGINTVGTEAPGQLWTFNGDTYLVFSSTGLPGAAMGNADAFLAKIIPEPSAVALVAGAGLLLSVRRVGAR